MRFLFGVALALLPLPAAGAEIIFADKDFYATSEYVDISGRLSGVGIGYENNTVDIACYRARAECYSTQVDQIGDNQLGRLTAPDILTVTAWTDAQVTAVEGDSQVDCWLTTVTISLKGGTATWSQQPVGPKPLCEDGRKAYAWTVERPPFWK